MSDKKNTAADTSSKVMTSYDKKVQRRKEQEAAAKKEALKSKIITAVSIVVVVAFFAYFPISTHIATTSTYAQVGEHKVTQVEFDYHYKFGYNNFVTQNSQLLPYLGIDQNTALDKTMYTENTTWDDYFQQIAITSLTQTKALAAAAKEADFEYDATEEVDAHIKAFETDAAAAGLSLKDYLVTMYGKYATVNRIKPILEESYYANAYYDSLSESLDVTEEELTAYYNENTKSFDSVDYRVITVKADIPQGESTVDEEGNATVANPTEEQVAEAMAAAKEKADKQLLFVAADGELYENAKFSEIAFYYNDWLFDPERKEGDTTVIEDKGNSCYYVVCFESRYLDEAKSVTARIIMTAEDKSETIKAEFEEKGSTEDAFVALVEKYSEDAYSNLNGGLYEEINASALSEELGDWLTGERTKGDFYTGKGSDGYYYAVYFVEQGREEWKVNVDYILRNDEMNTYMTTLVEGMDVIDTKGKLTYIENLAKDAEAAAKAAESLESSVADTTEE